MSGILRMLRLIFPFGLVLIILAIVLIQAGSGVNPFFQRTWGGSGTFVNAVVSDSSANIYVTGFTTSFGSGSAHLFLLKYDSTGGLRVQEIWGGSIGDYGLDAAVDQSGSIYVTGSTGFGAGSSDAVLLKFDSQGHLIWQFAWGSKNNARGNGVAVDSSGYVYVTGLYNDTGTVRPTFLLKLNSTGTLLWQRSWEGNRSEVASDLALDSSGNIYVTGWTDSFEPASGGQPLGGSCPLGSSCRYHFLLRYNSTGNLQWQRIWRMNNTSEWSGQEKEESITIDASGNIFVAGDAWIKTGVCVDCNMYLADAARLNSTGNLLWAKAWRQTVASDTHANDVSIDPAGNLYLTGVTNGDVLLLKIDPTGNLLNSTVWGGPGYDDGRSIAIDPSGIPIIAGTRGAPPYRYQNSTMSLETAAFAIATANGSTRPLSIPAVVVNGNLSAVSGGSGIAFISYGSSFPVPTFNPLMLVLTEGFLLTSILRIIRRRGGK